MKINQIIETQIDEIDRRGFLRGLGAAGAAAAVPGLAKAQSQTVPPVYLKAVNDIKAYLKPRLDKLPSPMIQYKKGIIVIKMTGSKVVGAEMKESTGVPKLDDYIIRVITAAGSFPQVQPLGRTGDHQMEFTTNNLLPAPGESTTQTQNQQPAQQNQSPTSEPSKDNGILAIKGLQMGMSPEEVKAKVGKSDSVSSFVLAGQNFDFALFKYTDNSLSNILLSIDISKNYNRSFEWSAVLDAVESKYGKGHRINEKFKTRAGAEYDNLKTIWILPDGSNISMILHSHRLGAGFISFTSPKGSKEITAQRDAKDSKNKSDI